MQGRKVIGCRASPSKAIHHLSTRRCPVLRSSHPAVTSNEPPHFPPAWADAWGDDRFGLWAEFSAGEVVQRLRWIEPGEFWMGSSPKTDPARFDDEGPRHRVRLSAGFWLADTTCTQVLWLAVVGGSNPSGFLGDEQCPVEQVSWDEVQGFLQRLAGLTPEMTGLCLPTEAQWEYACRAGTETPFSFGENITPQQVNYDGNHPYRGNDKGLYRERTVAVKSLPPNAWGLFEMHGNVWEWCDDAKRRYKESPDDQWVLNPQGPQEQGLEARRAVRGGSWFSNAFNARSAYRLVFQRGFRDDDLGFRFALRS